MSARCRDCKHFYITFDPKTPNGCKVYQIQCKGQPSNIVKRANNGEECIGFSPKVKKNQKARLDLNDSKLW